MTYDEFISTVILEKNQHPEWRWGQTYYNVLWSINVDLASYVHHTGADPFYFDKNIPEFLAEVHNYFETFGSVRDDRRSYL